MKIGIDFDKVFVDHPPLIPDILIDILYKKKNHSLKYRIPGKLEQKIRILSHSKYLRSPINNNIKTLSSMAKRRDLELYLISGRFGFLKNKTREWLKRHYFDNYFKKMYFNFDNEQPHTYKDRIIKEVGIKVFIDDDLDLINYLAKNNPNINFFWIKRNSRSKEVLYKNITAITNLEQFYKKFLK